MNILRREGACGHWGPPLQQMSLLSKLWSRAPRGSFLSLTCLRRNHQIGTSRTTSEPAVTESPQQASEKRDIILQEPDVNDNSVSTINISNLFLYSHA